MDDFRYPLALVLVLGAFAACSSPEEQLLGDATRIEEAEPSPELLANDDDAIADDDDVVEQPTARLVVSPETYDFGNVPIGCVLKLDVELWNEGDAELFVEELVFEDLAGNGELLLEHAGGLPWTIPPAQARTVAVYYESGDREADTGVLTITSSDPERERRTAQVFGLGSVGGDCPGA